MKHQVEQSKETELEITPPKGKIIAIKGELGSLNEDVGKIHQLLDLLELPEGTEVKITTRIGSVIVR